MGISANHKEEAISLAHVYAIAGNAGIIIENPNFDYGVDGRFSSVKRYNKRLISDGYNLPFQLKACKNIRSIQGNNDQVSYDMSVDAYERLRLRNENTDNTPQLLLVCELHSTEAEWVNGDLGQLTLKKCCYFHKFLNMPQCNKDPKSTQVVRLDKANLLTSTSLLQLFDSIKGKTYRN